MLQLAITHNTKQKADRRMRILPQCAMCVVAHMDLAPTRSGTWTKDTLMRLARHPGTLHRMCMHATAPTSDIISRRASGAADCDRPHHIKARSHHTLTPSPHCVAESGFWI